MLNKFRQSVIRNVNNRRQREPQRSNKHNNTTPAATLPHNQQVAFEIPNPFPSRNFQGEYDGLLRNVNAVNHGEFERAVDSLLEQAATTVDQGENRAAALAIQRCRRGGKTFMLHAVASMLQKDSRVTDSGMIVLFVSLNSLSGYYRTRTLTRLFCRESLGN